MRERPRLSRGGCRSAAADGGFPPPGGRFVEKTGRNAPLNIPLKQLVLLLSFSALTGCGHNAAPVSLHLAVIERVESGDVLPYQYYSVTKGWQPGRLIWLRLTESPDRSEPARLTVLALGAAPPGAYGRVGDTVSFHFAGKLPFSGEVSMDQLSDYRILP